MSEYMQYSVNKGLDGNMALRVFVKGADFFRGVRKNKDSLEITLLRANGERVTQSYPDDGPKVLDNAAAMLNGIISDAGYADEKEEDTGMLMAAVKELLAAVKKEKEELR